jgi:hypothetical protein
MAAGSDAGQHHRLAGADGAPTGEGGPTSFAAFSARGTLSAAELFVQTSARSGEKRQHRRSLHD